MDGRAVLSTIGTTFSRFGKRLFSVRLAIALLFILNLAGAGFYYYNHWWLATYTSDVVTFRYPHTWKVVRDPDSEVIIINNILTIHEFPGDPAVTTTDTATLPANAPSPAPKVFGKQTFLQANEATGSSVDVSLTLAQHGQSVAVRYPRSSERQLRSVLASFSVRSPVAKSAHTHMQLDNGN